MSPTLFIFIPQYNGPCLIQWRQAQIVLKASLIGKTFVHYVYVSKAGSV